MTKGRALTLIGAVHQLVGLALGWEVLGAMLGEGVIGSVGEDWTRAALFWFLVTGFLVMLAGELMRALEVATGAVPRGFGLACLTLGLLGAAFIPVSGFWLVVVHGVWCLAANGRAPRASSPATMH